MLNDDPHLISRFTEFQVTGTLIHKKCIAGRLLDLPDISSTFKMTQHNYL